jgi:hypothetical protein
VDSILKPRCALRVAVAGNRRFAGESDDDPTPAADAMRRFVAEACTAVWRAGIDAVQVALDTPVEHRTPPGHPPVRLADFFAPETPRLGILSALAAGADQIGARTALEVAAAGGPVEVVLDAVLPFPEPDYPGPQRAPRPEFRPEEADELRALAGAAAQVVRLDGEYEHPELRRRGYQHARDLILQRADLLVAVYDPAAPGRVAGTVETVGLALSAGTPVVAILVTEHEARVAVYGSVADRPAGGSEALKGTWALREEGWRRAVSAQVRDLLSLPHQLPAPGESRQQQRTRLETLGKSVRRLQKLSGLVRPHWMARNPLLARAFGGAWRLVVTLGRWCSGPHDLAAERPASSREEVTLEPWAAFYDRASLLAGMYMRTYRGAFATAFLLAALAVAAAVALLAWSLHCATGGQAPLCDGTDPPMATLWGLGLTKVGIILLLLGLERVSHQGKYQEHGTDFRYLAELLRPMPWLAPAGAVTAAVELPAHLAPEDPRRGWTSWLFRAIARDAPLVAGTREVQLGDATSVAALERVRDEWVRGQIRYHWSTALRMHGVDRGLERLAKGLLVVVLLFAVIALTIEVLARTGGGPPWITELHGTAILLGAGAAALPALIAALGGIMFQSEARRLAIRSEAMYYGLRDWQRGLDDDLRRLREAAGTRGHAWNTIQRLRALSGVMIEEAGDWKVLYQTHDVHAG